jgi:hypothetical protein
MVCSKCGKDWPEAYCPECGQSIAPPATAAPPVISASPAPAPIKPKSGNRSLIIAVGSVAALVALGAAGYFGYQLCQLNSFPAGYRNKPATGWSTRPGENEFEKANDQINSYNGSAAFGNSPAAIALAQQYSAALKTARDELFTRGLGVEIFESTQGNFLTYCELHDRECAFIVHVPGLRHFEENFTQAVDARKLLAQTAWATAQKVLKNNHSGKPQMELAVGVRGISQYGPIMLGYYKDDFAAPNHGIVKDLDDSTLSHYLWSFFATPASPAKPAP